MCLNKNMKKEKKLVNKLIYLLPFLLVFLIFSVFLVSGTTTLNTPLSGSNWSTTINFNCTTDLPEPLNATLGYNSSGGGVLTYLTASKVNNDTASDTYFYLSGIAITTLADGKLYNFTCSVDNGTYQELSAGRIKVGIDDTAPVLATTTDQSTGHQRDNIGLNWTCTDATVGVQTTSVSLSANGDAGCTISGTTSWSTATGSQLLTTTQTQCAGLYTVTSSCTDYSGNSASDSDTFNIYYPEGGTAVIPTIDKKAVIPTTTSSQSKKTLFMVIAIISLVIIAVISFFVISLSKRRR